MTTHTATTPPSHRWYTKGCRCDECRKIYSDYMYAYRRDNAAKLKKQAADGDYYGKYRTKHPEKVIAIAQKRTESGRARIANQRYRQNHPKKAREQVRRWQARAGREYLSRAMRRWRTNNPDYAVRYKTAITRARLKYRTSEKGRLKVNFWHSTRARRNRNAAGFATAEQLKARWDFYGGLCYICKQMARAMDHVIPLSRGGTNWPANLRPACTSCNSQKRNFLLSEFLTRSVNKDRGQTSQPCQ